MAPDDDPDAPVWRGRLERAIAAVDGWVAPGTVTHAVDPRSDLAVDDAATVAKQQVSQAAWLGLGSALEHLHMTAYYMRQVLDGSAPLWARAPFSLTRAALMGASHTVWVLAPDESKERVRRALSLAWHDHKDHGEFLASYQNDPVVLAYVTQEGATQLRQVIASNDTELAVLRKGVGGTAKSETGIIKAAAEYLLSSDPQPEPWLLHAYQWEWRLSSGGVHGRLWPFWVRATDSIPVLDDSGDQIRGLVSNLQQCATAMGAAVLMTDAAVRLWRQRSRRPDAGAAFGLA